MKALIKIGQSTYPCEVRDGVRYVNGMTVDDFIDTLPVDELVIVAKLGKAIFEGTPIKSPQAYCNEIHQANLN